MCEYCEGISNPISIKYNLGFMIRDNKIKIFGRTGSDNERKIFLEREINYCPFCGRKLGEEN